MPLVWPWPKRLGRSPNQGQSPRSFFDAGEAEPRLTSGGEAAALDQSDFCAGGSGWSKATSSAIRFGRTRRSSPRYFMDVAGCATKR